jgi:hypothetical protein
MAHEEMKAMYAEWRGRMEADYIEDDGWNEPADKQYWASHEAIMAKIERLSGLQIDDLYHDLAKPHTDWEDLRKRGMRPHIRAAFRFIGLYGPVRYSEIRAFLGDKGCPSKAVQSLLARRLVKKAGPVRNHTYSLRP